MKFSLIKLTQLFIILLVVQAFSSQASLLISPMRVALDERNRSDKVVLMNTGNETRTYRVEWVQKAALPLGGYKNLTDEEAKDFPIASNMFRLSPRQVTLAPNERQIVKIAARRPKNLQDGEYRSHLLFTALPREGDRNKANSGAGITLKLSLSYSIPVVFRQGGLDYQVGVEDLTLIHDAEKKQATVRVQLSRSGATSTTGSIVAYWTPKGSTQEKQVAILNSVNFYPELTYRVYNLQWFDYRPGAGTLRLAYEGREEMRNTLITEKNFNVSLSDIVTRPKK
ncbi:molecular chaperone [Thalassomonas actiniarum]|uniref:Molecular chaperone n=1 Tax=Thalassomonas actiniarum TaxID=485447 RepID=A0AAE9YQ68_9GAMM|nr:fimbria/pilus periplasmic chaperone [Thalassomonas actiniarum]WDD99259.1 molecular chaperone [Thalassomonas actiniarum]